jgi:hypothetical protein
MTTGATTLLNLLSNKNKLDPIDDNLDFGSFRSALWKWSESTTTSPSGRHLGHYKCLFANDHYEYTDDNPGLNEKIMKVYHEIAS